MQILLGTNAVSKRHSQRRRRHPVHEKHSKIRRALRVISQECRAACTPAMGTGGRSLRAGSLARGSPRHVKEMRQAAKRRISKKQGFRRALLKQNQGIADLDRRTADLFDRLTTILLVKFSSYDANQNFLSQAYTSPFSLGV
ncbi:MAG: hypothetical protein AB1584_14395 [Pseudomonadota bacterium]